MERSQSSPEPVVVSGAPPDPVEQPLLEDSYTAANQVFEIVRTKFAEAKEKALGQA